MFKKAVAITLSGIILLTPMTASAITWEEIVSGMGSGTYEKDGTRVEQGENGQYTVSGGKIDGTVDLGKLMGKFDLFFKNLQMENGMTIFAGVGTSYKVQLDSDVVVNGSIEGSAAENSIVDLTNNGEITDTVNLSAGGENAKLAFKNVGSVKNLNVEATDGGQAEAVNKGEVTETAWIGTDGENSLGKLTNEDGGTINQIYTDSSNGSTTELLNQGEVEYISANAGEKGTTIGTNEGIVNEHIRVGADGEGAQADMTNSGEANRFYGSSSNGGKTDMINEGKVIGDGSTVTVTDPNNGNSWEETSGELNGWSEGKGSTTTVINYGSANSSGNGSTDGSCTKVSNLGTIETYMSGGTSGSGSQLEFENSDTGKVGWLDGGSEDGASIIVTNDGEVADVIGVGADGKGSSATVSNNGTAGSMDATGSNGGEVKADNSGVVENGVGVNANGEGSKAELINSGEANRIYGNANEGGATSITNDGKVTGDGSAITITDPESGESWNENSGLLNGRAEGEGSSVTVVNNGTVGYVVGAGAEGKGSSATVSNNGTAGRMEAAGWNGGEAKANNSGVVEGKINVSAGGEGSKAELINSGEANRIFGSADEGGTTSVTNDGKVNGDGSVITMTDPNSGESWEETSGMLNCWANGEGSSMTVVNNGTVGYMVGVNADGKGSSTTVSNNGTAGSMDATGWNGGEVTANNSGIIENGVGVSAGGEGSKAELINSGEANRIFGNANEGGTTSITNDGKVTGDGSAITITDPNSGESWEETSGVLDGRADGEGSSMTVVNNGTVGYEVSVNAEGEGSAAAATNVGTAERMQINAENGAAATGTNQGTIHEEFGGWANGEGSKTELVNDGNAHISIGGANEGGTFSFENNGELADSFYGVAGGEGSKVDVVNNGKVGVDFQPGAENGGSASATNNGTVGRDLGSEVSSGGTVIITNHGEAAGVGSNVRDEGSSATVINNGTAQEFYIGVWDGGSATGGNTGIVEGNMGSGAFGGTTHLENGKDGVVGGTLHIGAGAGGTATAANQGSVGGFDVWADSSNDGMEEAAIYADGANAAEGESASAKGTNEGTISGSANVWSSGNSNAELINNGQANRLDVGAEENGASSVTNNGTIGSAGNSSNIEIWLNNGSVSLNNNGEIVPSTSADAQENILAFVKMPDGLSDEQLKQQLESLNIHTGNDPYSVLVQRVAFDEDGNETVKDYQKITYNEPIQPEQPTQPEQPKFEVPRREIERHEMEERRKDGAIGGVYGSPYWVKQLYLGYHSLNLRLYIGEHQALFRENLSWAGNSKKHLILRVNEAAPEKLTMRFDEDVLLTLERTEFAFITLTDKNGDVLMTYGLGDLRAAYDQYGYLMPLDLGRIHGENGAVIYGTVSSLNCIVVVLFTPFITRLFRRVIDTKKLLTGKLLFLAGYILFLTFLGTIPMYYAAMLIFTWGEIINTIADGPYLSARTPASHRGRINSVSGVAYTILRGIFNIAEGKAYDAYGSTAAWGLTIGALTISILLSVWLIFRDRARYPRLYEENAVEPAK